jgi:hypothetical protein
MVSPSPTMALARSILDLEHWFTMVHKGREPRDIAGRGQAALHQTHLSDGVDSHAHSYDGAFS